MRQLTDQTSAASLLVGTAWHPSAAASRVWRSFAPGMNLPLFWVSVLPERSALFWVGVTPWRPHPPGIAEDPATKGLTSAGESQKSPEESVPWRAEVSDRKTDYSSGISRGYCGEALGGLGQERSGGMLALRWPGGDWLFIFLFLFFLPFYIKWYLTLLYNSIFKRDFTNRSPSAPRESCQFFLFWAWTERRQPAVAQCPWLRQEGESASKSAIWSASKMPIVKLKRICLPDDCKLTKNTFLLLECVIAFPLPIMKYSILISKEEF